MSALEIDGTIYRTHAEVLNRFFEKNYVQYQRGVCKVGSGISVWFVQVEPGKSVIASSGYTNELSADGTHFTHIWPAPSACYTEENNPVKRIVFAKCGSKGYKFIGVFERTKVCSDRDEFRRIAVTYP